MLRVIVAAYWSLAFAMFSDVTGEIVDVTPASKLNDSPEQGQFVLLSVFSGCRWSQNRLVLVEMHWLKHFTPNCLITLLVRSISAFLLRVHSHTLVFWTLLALVSPTKWSDMWTLKVSDRGFINWRNRRVKDSKQVGTPKISLACPFQYLNSKGGYCVHSIQVPVPGSWLLIINNPVSDLPMIVFYSC